MKSLWQPLCLLTRWSHSIWEILDGAQSSLVSSHQGSVHSLGITREAPAACQTSHQGNQMDAVTPVTKLTAWASASLRRAGIWSYKARALAFLPGLNSKTNTGFHINYSSHFQNICSSFSFLVIITEAIIRLQRYIDHIFKTPNQGIRSDLCLEQR